MPQAPGSWFDDNRAVWLAGVEPYVPEAPLKESTAVDVAIIGGGFTGVSTAYHLSGRYPDKRIVLIEARSLGNGASGRNGGQMLNWVHGVDPEDPERARHIYDATREGIDSVLSMIDEHGLDVAHGREGHLDVFVDERHAEDAAAAVAGWNEAGLPLRYLRGKELEAHVPFEGASGAIFDPEGGYLDGAAFVRALKPVLLARGVEIFESTPVTRIREGRTIALETPTGVVRAESIVLATNAYTPHLGYFRSGIVPVHSHVVATEPATEAEWSAKGFAHPGGFSDDLDRLSYGTLFAGPGRSSPNRRLLFGGGSNHTYDYLYGNGTRLARDGARAFAANRRQLLSYFPNLSDVALTHRWSGPIALTLSRMCTIGVRGEHRNVYFGLGYSGHGVTMANLAGRVIADIYSGSDERWRELPFHQQSLRYIPPEPFRYLGYQAFTRLTGRSPRRHEPDA